MKSETGGVDAEAGSVLHNGKLHLIKRAAFIKPLNAVNFFKPLNDRLFYNLLAVGDGEELGVEAIALNGEGSVFGDEHLPGESLGAFEKLVEGEGIERTHFYEHALADAQIYIGSCNVFLVAGEENAAVFGGNISHFHAAQLVCDRAFKTQKTRHTKFIIHFLFLHFSLLICLATYP